MKPVYAIINDKERNDFEKKFQIPYGYSACELFDDFDVAIKYFDSNKKNFNKHTIIEQVDSSGRCLVYKM